MARKQARGAMAHARGLSAEDQVARHYEAQGYTHVQSRWRGQGAEIDLIFRNGVEIVFIEVKSSRTHEQAATLLSARQLHRLAQAAEEFLGTQPLESLTPMRLDVALVDTNGAIDILENALMEA